MPEAAYEVRRRRWPSIFPRLQRPWELLRDDRPVGFYKTEQEARSVLEATLVALKAAQ